MRIMAAGNELDSGEGESISESRQRLRPWLISKLDKQHIPGLRWIKQDEKVFRIPWKHGGKQDWVQEHAQIFMEWAKHTGKYREGIDTPTYAKWKTNLRCALNKAPDIKEITELSKKDEPNPYKVYKFLERKKKTLPHLKNPNQYIAPPQEVNTTVPTVIHEFSSGTQQHSDEARVSTQGAVGMNVETDRYPSDLNSLKSGDLVEMGSQVLSMSEAIPSQEGMDFDVSQVQESPSPSSYSQPSPSNSYIQQPSPYQPAVTSQHRKSNLTPPAFPVPDVQLVESSPQLVYAAIAKTENTSPTAASIQVETMPPAFPVPEFVSSMPHSCVEKHGAEMNVEVLYRSSKVMEYHVDHDKGCRITHGRLPPERECEIPNVLKDVLYGVDSKDLAVIDLPEWRRGLCSDDLIPSVNDLLRNMQRGLILECCQGNMSAMRLCKTSIYFSSITGTDSHKLVRHDTIVEKTPIFNMDEFIVALENYKANNGERPSADIYLFIGQRGTTQEIDNILIVVKVTSCKALRMLREVYDDKINSIHISDTTDMDKINDCVHGELQDPSILVIPSDTNVLQTNIKFEPSQDDPLPGHTQYSDVQNCIVPITTQYGHVSAGTTMISQNAGSSVSSHLLHLEGHYNSPPSSQQNFEHMQNQHGTHFAHMSDDSNSAMQFGNDQDIGATTTVGFEDVCMSIQD